MVNAGAFGAKDAASDGSGSLRAAVCVDGRVSSVVADGGAFTAPEGASL